MNEKQIALIIVALLVALALGLLASTVDAQAPPLPPDGPAHVISPVSPVSPITPPLPGDVPGVVPVSPIAPPLPADGDVDVIGAQVSPTPEPTVTPESTPLCVGLPSGWVLCYE